MKQKKTQKWRKRDVGLLSLALILLILFVLWQNNDLTVTQYVAQTAKAVPEGGLRIVQVSDLHNKAFGKQNETLLSRIREQNPDLILLTGDTVDSRRTNIDIALEFASAATEIAPVYFVSGNHETRLPYETKTALYAGLQECGVHILNDETKTVNVRGCEFVLLGLDDAHLADGTLQTLCADLPENTLQILLAHEPQELANYAAAEVDFVFSGHTHGGQVRLPVVGGLAAPDQGLFPYYDAGEFTEQNTVLYISRGLGNSLFPVRVFNRPELVVVTVTTEE
ncbi:MAG: metallophosphoesterase [Candidatus Fimenecus sp.]